MLFEAKVLADASCGIGFDVLRNQLARNIDVMLQPNPNLQKPLTQRLPGRTCFVLITPEIFRDHPQSRLYGWLMRDYQHHPAALRRDLPHRTGDRLCRSRQPTGLAQLGGLQPGAARRMPMAPGNACRDWLLTRGEQTDHGRLGRRKADDKPADRQPGTRDRRPRRRSGTWPPEEMAAPAGGTRGGRADGA